MKKEVWAGLGCTVFVLVLLAPIASGVIGDFWGNKEGIENECSALSPQSVNELIKRDHAPVVCDVRSFEDYSQGHIEGARSLPLSYLLCASCVGDILAQYAGREVIVYCEDGTESTRAAAMLTHKGVSDIYVLEGGIAQWKKEGFCSVSDTVYGDTEVLGGATYFTGGVPPECENSTDTLTLPAHILSEWDWRNVEGHDWTTPVKNQGSCGSCWGFAAMGALESVIKIGENSSRFSPDLSEQYLLSCPPDSGGCSGWSAHSAYEYLFSNGGAIPEECFPYSANDNIPCSAKCASWEDALVPISGYGIRNTPGRDYIKVALQEYGPVVAGMAVYSDFHSYRGGVYEHPGSEPVDDMNHEIVLVGYNDDVGYWIGKNSWGTGWGNNGFFKIAYGDCQIEHYIVYVTYDAERRNWPPVADAGGPYYGRVGEPILFDGRGSFDADENIVSYSWNFGDGTVMEGVTPTYQYSREGVFTVRLMVGDEGGEYGVDETVVYVDESPPNVAIEKPKDRYLYILDMQIMSLLFKTRVIGGITIDAYAYDTVSGVTKVEFYVDDELKATDYELPYNWHWGESTFWDHTLKVIGYDAVGNSASDELEVWVLI